ncbi:hypothetical protein HDV06_006127 [Boothiomyces sp. JEL0866]|nr:hypothetical protein HDV06_006127 [Boothiomyces sp. JEL0866]
MLSTSNVNRRPSHLNLSLYKPVMFNNTPESSKRKTLKLKTLFNKKQQPVDIKATAYYDAKLLWPFRFTPLIDASSSGLQAFITLVEDEKHYAAALNATIERLESLEPTNTILFVKEYLSKIIRVTNNLEKAIDSSPDIAIISKLKEIYSTYSDYLSIYVKFEVEWQETVKSNQKNILFDLARPFQRLLEYRFFLHCIKKYHHGCDSKCNIKTCAVKLKCNAANQEATNHLNNLIGKISKVFGVQDHYGELSKWEEYLQTSKCRAIGEQNGKPELYKLELYLTVPYRNPAERIGQLPNILASEEFQILPISEHVKLFSKKNNHFVLNNVNSEDLVLHMLTDTLVITGKIDVKTNQMHLLYPPMPLTHISIEKNLIRSKDAARGHQFVDSMIEQTGILRNFKEVENIDSASSPVTNISDQTASKTDKKVFVASEIDKFKLQSTAINNIQTNGKLYDLQCIPYIFRVEDSDSSWVRISKCDLIMEKVDGKYIVSLCMCDTKKCVLNATITSSTRVKRDSNPKRFFMSIFSEDVCSNYLIQVGTKEKADSIVAQITSIVFETVTDIYSGISSWLVNQDYPNWIQDNQCSFQHINLGKHSSCLVTSNDSNWVNAGSVSTYLIVNEIEDQEFSTMLIIRSEINPLLTFLRLELIPSMWSLRSESGNLIHLRVFSDAVNIDFNLTIEDLKPSELMDKIIQQSKIRESKLQKIASENEMKSCSSKATEIGGLINSYIQSVELEKDETVINLEDETPQINPSKEEQIETFEAIKERYECRSKESIPDSIEEIITTYKEQKPALPLSKSTPNLSRKRSSDSLETAISEPEVRLDPETQRTITTRNRLSRENKLLYEKFVLLLDENQKLLNRKQRVAPRIN